MSRPPALFRQDVRNAYPSLDYAPHVAADA